MYIHRTRKYIQAMNVKIAKWGNSLGIRIPKSLIREIGLQEEDELEISTEGNKLIIIPKNRKKYTLSELLEGMEEKHLHSEVDWGEPAGNELW